MSSNRNKNKTLTFFPKHPWVSPCIRNQLSLYELKFYKSKKKRKVSIWQLQQIVNLILSIFLNTNLQKI